jgi:hypothetical protein
MSEVAAVRVVVGRGLVHQCCINAAMREFFHTIIAMAPLTMLDDTVHVAP